MSELSVSDHLEGILSDFEALKRSFDIEDVDEMPTFSPTSPLNSPFSPGPASKILAKSSDNHVTATTMQPTYQSRITFNSNSSPLQSPVMKAKISTSLSFNRGTTQMARTNGNAGTSLTRVSSFQTRINPNGFSSAGPASDSDSLHSSTSSLEYQSSTRLGSLPSPPQSIMGHTDSGIKINRISSPVLKKFSSQGNMFHSESDRSLRIANDSAMNHGSMPSLDLHIAEDSGGEIIPSPSSVFQTSPAWNSVSFTHNKQSSAVVQIPNSKLIRREPSFSSPEPVSSPVLNSTPRQQEPLPMKLNKFPLNLDSLVTKPQENPVHLDPTPKPLPRAQLKLNIASISSSNTETALHGTKDATQLTSTNIVPPPGKFPVPSINESPVPLSPAQILQFKVVSQPQLVQVTSPTYHSRSTPPMKTSRDSTPSDEASMASLPKEHIGSVVQRVASFSRSENPGSRIQSPCPVQTENIYNGKMKVSEKQHHQKEMEIREPKQEDHESSPPLPRKFDSKKDHDSSPSLLRKFGSKKESSKSTGSMAEKDPESDKEQTRGGKHDGMGHELFGYVGIEAVLDQMRRKAMKTGFEFNIMVVGQSGLGKSTLVNTLFKSKVSRKSCNPNHEEKIFKTVELQTISHVIEEKGVKMKLTVIDTPGFGDQINNENCWEPIVKYIQEQYEKYLREEIVVKRKRRIPDTRVHCCIYFVPPTGHWLRPLDLEFMKRLYKIVNVVPVIAKADTLTLEERKDFKQRIRQGLQANGISVYPQKEFDEDAGDRLLNDKIRENIPFAVVGTDKEHQVNGKRILGRKTKWGIIEVENVAHCEFALLRDLLIRSHLQDLKDVTHYIHYETYRVNRLNENYSLGRGLTHLNSFNGTLEKEETESNL